MILGKAYEILQNGGIARGYMATDGEGNPSSVVGGERFCSIGAVARACMELGVYDEERLRSAVSLLRRVAELGDVATTTWNDHYADDDEILDVFRTAAGIKDPAQVALV